MTVHYRADIPPCAINFAVYECLQKNARSRGREGVAVEIDLDDIIGGDESRCHRSRDQETVIRV